MPTITFLFQFLRVKFLGFIIPSEIQAKEKNIKNIEKNIEKLNETVNILIHSQNVTDKVLLKKLSNYVKKIIDDLEIIYDLLPLASQRFFAIEDNELESFDKLRTSGSKE